MRAAGPRVFIGGGCGVLWFVVARRGVYNVSRVCWVCLFVVSFRPVSASSLNLLLGVLRMCGDGIGDKHTRDVS